MSEESVCVAVPKPLPLALPTPQQMELIVRQAQSAPLQNMQHAQALSDALVCLAQFVDGSRK